MEPEVWDRLRHHSSVLEVSSRVVSVMLAPEHCKWAAQPAASPRPFLSSHCKGLSALGESWTVASGVLDGSHPPAAVFFSQKSVLNVI